MTKLMKTIQISTASAVMLAASAIPAFAYNRIDISIRGNGARSRNTAIVNLNQGASEDHSCLKRRRRMCAETPEGVTQESKFSSKTFVNIMTNTGDNTLNGTTTSGKGDDTVKIVTGDVTTDVFVRNIGGSNVFNGF